MLKVNLLHGIQDPIECGVSTVSMHEPGAFIEGLRNHRSGIIQGDIPLRTSGRYVTGVAGSTDPLYEELMKEMEGE